MSDCSTNANGPYDVARLRIEFEGEEIPWMYPLALNGRVMKGVYVDGVEYLPRTGTETDLSFILPKPRERLFYYGQIKSVDDDGAMKMYSTVQLIDDALKRWQGEIDDEIQRRLFETFAEPQSDERGEFVMVQGERYERVRECNVIKLFSARFPHEFGNEVVELSCGHLTSRHDSFCPKCGARVRGGGDD